MYSNPCEHAITIVNKQKVKIFLVISDFELQTDQGNKSTEETAVVSKEKSIFPDGDSLRQIKDIITKNVSFIHW